MKYAITLVTSLVCVVLTLQNLDGQTTVQERTVHQRSGVVGQNPYVAEIDLGQKDPFKEEYPELFETKGQIVAFTATWCGPCKTQKIYTNALKGRFNVIEFDIDTERGRKLYNRFNGDSIPTTVIVVEGKLKKKFVGVTPASKIEQFASEARKDKKNDDEKERTRRTLRDWLLWWSD